MRQQVITNPAILATILYWLQFFTTTGVVGFSMPGALRPIQRQSVVVKDIVHDIDVDYSNAMDDIIHDNHSVHDRKQFLSNAVAITSSLSPLFFSAEAAADSLPNKEPTTRIELTVDTEYLIRVLEYFDGDMRKVLGVLVRAPQTTVEIEPPRKKKNFFGSDSNNVLSPRDAILRALYSYKSPEDYVTQARWLKVDEPNNGWVDFLTKKRYKIYLPSIGKDETKEDGMLEVIIQSSNLNLSNLELAATAVILSYPLAYSYYNYESFIEEKEKAAKKAQLAAKNAAKAAGATKGEKKKNANRDNTVKRSDKNDNKQSIEPKVLSDKAMVIDSTNADSGNFKDPITSTNAENQVVINSKEQSQSKSMAIMSEAYPNREFAQSNDELEQLIAAAAAAAATTDNTNDQFNVIDVYTAEPNPITQSQTIFGNSDTEGVENGSRTMDSFEMKNKNNSSNLRSLIENTDSYNMKRRGPLSNSYLDSL